MNYILKILKNQVLGKATLLFFFLLSINSPLLAQGVWINEIKYDNPGADIEDTIEIAGIANIDLNNYTIVLYNGNSGTVYHTEYLYGIIDDELNGFGAISFVFDETGIQNGGAAGDGIALVDPANNVIQFLSYEAVLTATDGPAMGMVSEGIGVLQDGSSAPNSSLQLQGTGTKYSDFTWSADIIRSYNVLNPGQIMDILTTTIPDDNFEQALIDLGYDDVPDNTVLTTNIYALSVLDISDKNITDLTGIEDFASLTTLFCQDNLLTSIDVSQLTVLDYLRCANNQLTTLDISQNTILTTLFCDGNQLTSIDTSENPLLWKLTCGFNLLTSLDFSQNPDLWSLNFEGNQLTTIDVSQNLDLASIDCSTNLLTSIDVSVNTDLAGLTCTDNQITSIDVSLNTGLTVLRCQNNELTYLDARNGNNSNLLDLNAFNNPNLICVYVDDAAFAVANFPYIDDTATFVETEAGCASLAVENYKPDVVFSLYPNPVSDAFIIQTTDQILDVSIYDIFGKIIKTYKTQDTYNISDLTSGVYMLKVTTGSTHITSKNPQ